MRILMLGNSFTFVNDMPAKLSQLTGAEVVQHTRGGARLAEHLNPKTKMGTSTLSSLANEQWDYVVLQEMSNAPIVTKPRFLQAVSGLCAKIRLAGAVPVLYATWAYQKDGPAMQKMNVSYDEMYRLLYEAYHEAAEQNNALIADVGKSFYEKSNTDGLYADDGCHPNEAGSRLAAEILADVINNDAQIRGI